MRVRFLLGPAGSGKTFRCLQEMGQALAEPEGPPLLMLAPKQATFQLERQILALPGIGGYTRLQILSFERLAELMLENLQGAPPRLLEEEGRLMVLRALLMEKQSELKIFHATARLPGFARQLSVLLRECQRSQVTSKRLQDLAAKVQGTGALALKLSDLALLLAAYREWLDGQGLQDATSLLDLAAEELGALSRPGLSAEDAAQSSHSGLPVGDTLQLGGIWLDGFAEMTGQELELLASIVPLSQQTTLAFCLDHQPQEDPSWLSTWSVVGQTYRRCWQRLSGIPGIELMTELLERRPTVGRFRQCTVLRHLEENWPVTSPRCFVASGGVPAVEASEGVSSVPEVRDDLHRSLRLVHCGHPEGEALMAAREVLRFVRESGARFRDCAVLVRSQEAYHAVLRRVFSRYGIPFFMDRREPMGHHPMAELTRSALRVAALQWRHDDLFSALKTGLAGLDDAGTDWLENAALAHGWTGNDWLQPLKDRGDSQDMERAEATRLTLAPVFEGLAEGLSAGASPGPSGSEIAVAVREFWDRLKVREQLEQWSEAVDAQWLQPRSIHLTVWEEMQGWLRNLELAFPDRQMPLREWLPILESGMASLTVGVIPPALDQVMIGAIDRSRNPELRLAIVLGVNEGVFPAPPMPPAILTEAERARLTLEEVPLGMNSRRHLGHERYFGYIAFSRSTERLVVAWSTADRDGKTLNASPFIGHLLRMFPELRTEEFSRVPPWQAAEHVSDLAADLVRSRRREFGGADDLESEPQSSEDLGMSTELVERFAQIPSLRSLDERCHLMLEGLAATSLKPVVAEQLYGKSLMTSVSALEDYAACPFKFFVARGLGAKEREFFEADVRERGSFQHELLERFHVSLRESGRKWRDLTPQAAVSLVQDLGNLLLRSYRGGLFESSPEARYMGRQLVVRVARMMGVLVGWMAQYRFDPVAVELSFGLGDPGLPGWKVPVDEHHELLLRGRIDRIDVCELSGEPGTLAVVVDYKSSNKTLSPVRLEHGLQLQLLSYLGVLKNAPDLTSFLGTAKVDPIGVFYISLKPQRLLSDTRAEGLEVAEAQTQEAYRHQGRFDRSHLALLDSRGATKGDQFVYSKNKSGEFSARGNQGLTPMAFADLQAQVARHLTQFGQQIYAGRLEPSPYQIKKERACDFCEFRSVCRFDPWTDSFRILREAGEA
ncbi:MAG: PD-(D/E)XK nuclease family protein [Verrucomicrobiales bacterium]|nr:PD-(D/E)XK nuclease family protein [Verrucomicrobiales bacterium]